MTEELDEKENLDEDLEDESTLDETEPDTKKKYEQAQRELVTQAVEFQIKNLAEMVDRAQIDTSPNYQRRLRWDDRRKSKLIESILLNVPIPPIFLAEEKIGVYSVIDGQQRLRTISDFFKNLLTLRDLEVFSELNGLRFDDLPSELKTILNIRPIFRCVILLRQSHPDIKYEVFERLNTGGVKLNQQELRNSAYRGPLNDLIIALSENRDFRQSLRVRDPSTSAIVQHMRDCELILRFFALKDTWREFKHSIKDTLNKFMSVNQDLDRQKIEGLSKDFTSSLAQTRKAFGDHTFRRFQPEKGEWGGHILASVFDAQMFACYSMAKENLPVKTEGAVERLERAFKDDRKFLDSIVAGTNQHSKLNYRVQKVREILTN